MSEFVDFAAELEAITRLAAKPEAIEDLLARALDALETLVPYDLAAVMELHEQRLEVRVARGVLANAAVRAHSIDLRRFPTIQRALDTRQPIALQEHHHASEEGDTYAGVLDLQDGHSCMIVPLHAGDLPLGVMSFDRRRCEPYDPKLVRLAGVYGQVVALALLLAHQTRMLERQRARLDEGNRLLRGRLTQTTATQRIERTASPGFRHLLAITRQVAATDAPVLIGGETGTGKELLAEAIHAWSGRAGESLVAVNCAALPESLLESELFGHVKGAFSGAATKRTGRFAAAHGGTLLLDEVGDLPLAAQAKLLRVLQSGTFEPVGSDATVKVDVRVIAATHVNLEEAVTKGRFREDLYYRLNLFPITLPPLRQRPEDIELIARTWLDDFAQTSGRGPWQLSDDVLERLVAYGWPGNVRELVNSLERSAILSPPGPLQLHLSALAAAPSPALTGPTAPPTSEPIVTLEEAQRQHIVRALRRTGYQIAGDDGAAALLGLKPTTLASKMAKLGLNRKELARS